MSHAYINYSYIKICALSTVQLPYITPHSFQNLDGAISNCFFLFNSLQWHCEEERDVVLVSILKKDLFFVCVPRKDSNLFMWLWGSYMNFLFFKDFIYLFLDRGEGREKERERNINVWLPLTRPVLGTRPATQACALTANWAGDPLILRRALNHWATPARAAFCVFDRHPIGTQN